MFCSQLFVCVVVSRRPVLAFNALLPGTPLGISPRPLVQRTKTSELFAVTNCNERDLHQLRHNTQVGVKRADKRTELLFCRNISWQ